MESNVLMQNDSGEQISNIKMFININNNQPT